MKKLIEFINEQLELAFHTCGYDPVYGVATLSNRPDLCQYQCNGALTAAKRYKISPIEIAKQVAKQLTSVELFESVEAISPGFINLNLSNTFIAQYLETLTSDPFWGCDLIGKGKTIVIDYGGPNVAKPLHVGHLRTAIIGESLKRIGKYLGFTVLGDVHLGDWGLPIGLIITELKKRQPHLEYFDKAFLGEYPQEAPFTITELEDIYPTASSYAKTNPSFMEEAKQATYLFQSGHKGYVALWKHILHVSITDLKKNYANLNVYFDLWKKESDAQPYIPQMTDHFKVQGLAYMSNGALVVDVKEATDTKEMPPCILVKSDGATLYSTTDLATILERQTLYHPDEIIYIVDKRQEMHFEQVFRCAKKGKLITPNTQLTFLGFGTMNGKDGKPFKTRDGGVMRLEHLIDSVAEKVHEKVSQNTEITAEEAHVISHITAIAALKYGDLSNQIAKDYIFDLERFTAFEGNTGPYILYTVVRIQSILDKFNTLHTNTNISQVSLTQSSTRETTDLMLKITHFNDILPTVFNDYAPHKLCQYIYELSNLYNRFYHTHKILSETCTDKQHMWIKLSMITKDILVTSLDMLGIDVPQKM